MTSSQHEILADVAQNRKALDRARQEQSTKMAQSPDFLLNGGTVVNHDGAAVRDLGIAGGRIAALGGVSGARPMNCRRSNGSARMVLMGFAKAR